MRLESHDFRPADLVGGDPALDLVNTVTARDSQARDWLEDYSALLRWAEQRRVLARAEAAALSAAARARPAHAAEALARAKTLREALCRALYASAQGRSPAPAAVRTLDRARLAASQAARLRAHPARLSTEWSVSGSSLDLAAHRLTAHAFALFQGTRLQRLRVCDGRHCGWVFLDSSKSGRRRWCDMATCGNLAKAQRFHQRQRG